MAIDKPQLVLFDFDGVIADSFATAFAVQKKACPHLTAKQYRARFDGNINEWRDVAALHNETCRLDRDFFAEYVPRLRRDVHLVDGMKDVIVGLARKYVLIIISSTISRGIHSFLQIQQIESSFREILGNDVEVSKVAKIRAVLMKYRTKPENCVFITDTLGDIREAEQAGVGSIGVSWGYQARNTLVEGHPFMIVNQPERLCIAIENFFEAASSRGGRKPQFPLSIRRGLSLKQRVRALHVGRNGRRALPRARKVERRHMAA